MASVSEGSSGRGGRWGRRSLDSHVNLVPYIDLMTTIITFLMMTAVWTQIAALEVQNGNGGPEEQEQVPPDLDQPKAIYLELSQANLLVSEEGEEATKIARVGEAYDLTGLAKIIGDLKEERPERVEVKLQSHDGVQYDDIVDIIDLVSGLGLTSITLKPA